MRKIHDYLRKNYLWLVAGLCLLFTLFILEDVLNNEIMKCDTWSYTYIIMLLRNNHLTIFMKIITNLGSAITLILICIILSVVIKNKKIPLYIILNLIIITIINQALKFIVQRPRPIGYRIIDERGYSFPSGHSMVSVAFYGFIIYLIYKNIKNKKVGCFLTIFLVLLIILIGFSRVYLGVHYASDVIAGALISIAYLIIYIKATNKYLALKK